MAELFWKVGLIPAEQAAAIATVLLGGAAVIGAALWRSR